MKVVHSLAVVVDVAADTDMVVDSMTTVAVAVAVSVAVATVR